MEAGHFKSYHLVLLAEVYGKAGQAEEGLAVLADALAVVDKSGERFYEAELYRLRGELLLKNSGARSQKSESRPQSSISYTQYPTPDTLREAEVCFLKVIEIARRQQAKSWELRATMSLARLWQQQGKKKQARKRLAKIYNWFTKGFDTKDLQEAKELLEELSH
jgi:predicted ATPase